MEEMVINMYNDNIDIKTISKIANLFENKIYEVNNWKV